MQSQNIQKLIDLFSKFPTVGRRTASRFVFYLVKMSGAEFEELTDSMKKLRESTKQCPFCFNPFEVESSRENSSLCSICANPARNKSIICVVEKEADLLSIENTKKYQGLYFIFGHAMPLLKNNGNDLKISALQERIKNPGAFGQDAQIKEVIIATNLTYEGEAGGLYIERKLKSLQLPYSLKITHLARGLPTGGEIEYADEETLKSAFEGRK